MSMRVQLTSMGQMFTAAKMQGDPKGDEHDNPVDGLEDRHDVHSSVDEHRTYGYIDLTDHLRIGVDDA